MPVYGTVKYGEALYGAMNFAVKSYLGRYRGLRFNMLIASQGVEMFDKLIDSDVTIYHRYMIQGLILGFTETHNFIHMMIPYFDDLQVADESFLTWFGDDNGIDSLQLRGVDFLDGRRIRWGLGAIPFDVSTLVVSCTSGWTGATGYAEGWAALGNTAYITTSGSGSMYATKTDLKKGTYRAYYLLKGTDGTEDALLFTYNVTETLYSENHVYSNISAAGGWHYVDFQVKNDGDTIRFYVQDNSAEGTAINCGEVIIWPITNSKNFPLDNQNRALQLTTQKLRGAAK